MDAAVTGYGKGREELLHPTGMVREQLTVLSITNIGGQLQSGEHYIGLG
jgi:hypothetical protein